MSEKMFEVVKQLKVLAKAVGPAIKEVETISKKSGVKLSRLEYRLTGVLKSIAKVDAHAQAIQAEHKDDAKKAKAAAQVAAPKNGKPIASASAPKKPGRKKAAPVVADDEV